MIFLQLGLSQYYEDGIMYMNDFANTMQISREVKIVSIISKYWMKHINLIVWMKHLNLIV